MITVERTFTVACPAATVFDYLADFTTTTEWDPGTVVTTRTDSGPLGVGALFHNVSEFRGRRTELDYRCMVHEPNTHVVFTGENKTVTATDDLTLRAEGDSTVVTYRARFVFKGLARLAEPFLRKGFEPIADETIAQLSRTLDALPGRN